MTLLHVETVDRVTTLSMRDSRRRNMLGAAMMAELVAAFDTLDPATRAVVLRAGPGNDVWCAGFDIAALDGGHDPLAPGGPLKTLFDRVAQCPVPVIGMVHGSTWGGGTDLALRCDMLIGDSTAQFAFTPARLGLPYDADGLRNVLVRVGPALALEMFATAQPVTAERALRAGLLNHLVEPDALEAFTNALTRTICDNAPLSVTSATRHLRALAAALPIPPPLTEALAESRIRALASEDYREGLAAFAAKRRPDFKGQ